MTYLDKLKTLEHILKINPNIDLFAFETFPPASDEQIKEAQQFLGTDLSADILSFFKETNGLKLLYAFKDNEALNNLTKLTKSVGTDWFYLYKHEYPGFDGCILIPPIQLLCSQEFDLNQYSIEEDYNPLYVDGEEIQDVEDFCKTVKIFNPCSRVNYYCMYTLKGQTMVILTGDYGSDLFMELEEGNGMSFHEFMNSQIINNMRLIMEYK